MKSFLKRFNKEFVKVTTMKYHNLTLFIFAALSAAGTYAQEQEYATEITEDTQYNAPLTGDTAIKNGATLTLTTSNTGSNYNLLIESGAKLVHGVDSTDAFKWGTGSPNSMSAVIENYGTIDMQSNKAFRFGDDGAGYSTTLNLYDGSLMTSTTGDFAIENYRGASSIINVYEGAQITNLRGINTWDRSDESSENPLFQLNVAGGSVSMSGDVNFGRQANNNSITQTSELNVTDGGTFTSTGSIYLGNAANNVARLNVSGAESKLSANSIMVSRNTDAKGSMSVSDGGTVDFSGTLTVGAADGASGTVEVTDGGILQTTAGGFVLGSSANSNASLSVTDGGIVNVRSYNERVGDTNVAHSVNIQIGLGASSSADILFQNGAVFNVNGDASTWIRLGNGSGVESSFTLDNSTLNMNATADLNIALGYGASDADSSFIVTNGALVQQYGNNIQFNMYGGENYFELSNGSTWAAATNFYVGNSDGSVSTMVVDGSMITGSNGSATGFSSDLHTASAGKATAYVEIKNGGIVNLRGLNVSQGHGTVNIQDGAAGAVSYITISGNGSLLATRNVNNTNYHNRLGVNKLTSDGSANAAYEGNVASLTVHTGAQFLNTQNAIQVYDSGQITLKLDSSGIGYAMDNGLAMVSTDDLHMWKTDDTVSSPFVIDGSALGYIEGASEGDIYEFALLSVSGDILFNDVTYDLSSMSDSELTDFVSTIFEFQNNTDLSAWEDFDASNVLYNGGTFYISLTYVPEPSTVAAIFGALALAFAAYRRRK